VLHDIFYTSVRGEDVTKRSISDQLIHLEGVSKSDFYLMLRVMFHEPLWGQLESESRDAGATQAAPSSWKDWASVLKLSTQLQLESIRETSIRQLSCLSMDVTDWINVLRVGTEWGLAEVRKIAMDKIVSRIEVPQKINLAIEFKIEKWLLEGFRRLVERSKEILLDEEEQLGWETTFKLFRLRHLLLQRRINECDLDQVIRDKFPTEFEGVTYPSKSNETQTASVTKAYLIDGGTVTWVNSLQFSSVIFLVGCLMHMIIISLMQ
jgi:hypothetical protein